MANLNSVDPPARAPRTQYQKSKHPHGRRNTLIRSYTRQALGFAAADRDEKLITTKFRHLPSRERRFYTLSLGYGLRDDRKSVLSGGCSKKRQRPEMTSEDAVALMARLHEMLLHGGRTVEGVCSALGFKTSHVDAEQYKTALEHIPVRAGTSIPTGAAEGALATLYDERIDALPFLTKNLVTVDAWDGTEEANQEDDALKKDPPEEKGGNNDTGEEEASTIAITPGEISGLNHPEESYLRDQQEKLQQRTRVDDKETSTTNSGDVVTESYSLPRLSAALEAFATARNDQGHPLEGLAIDDLVNFLYLRDQTKITLKELKDLVGKDGRWAYERARRKARERKDKLAEAARSVAAGKAFSLTDEQLNAAVDFLDPNQDGNIDLEELMLALRKERTTKAFLEKGGSRKKKSVDNRGGSSASLNHDDDLDGEDKKMVDSGQENGSAGELGASDREDEEGGKGEGGESLSRKGGQECELAIAGEQPQEIKGQRPLFSLEEAESLTNYLMESQQAFSLINVADIQHGMRVAKRAVAQAASRAVYRKAAKRFATELRDAGMVLESDAGWIRWFDMCELGLRAGAAGAKPLVGRKELKRGLKALLAAPKVPPAEAIDSLAVVASEGRIETQEREDETEKERETEKGQEKDLAATARRSTAGSGRRGHAWSEQEVDDLLNAIFILGDAHGGRNAESNVGGDKMGGGDADLTDVDFREKLMFAIEDGGNKEDRDLEAAHKNFPLTEKLQSYLRHNGLRLGQLFERMVAWTRDASDKEQSDRDHPPLVSPRTTAGNSRGSTRGQQRGDDSCVVPAALKAVLVSLKTGGLSAEERLKAKLDVKLAEKEEKKRKAAEGMSAEAAKRMAEAEKSGASTVLALLRESIASKSIRIVELFNALDTSKDGLISRKELREGLVAIAESSIRPSSSLEQIREECRRRRRSMNTRDSHEKEQRRAAKLRARILAAEGSGAAKVLRRIHEYLLRTGHKVMDLFHSFSLRGNLTLTTMELEMALSLVDGLDLTRREVRSVVRFLDKDSSGTIDVAEVDEALRDFRALSRDLPSLGTGPMTVIDSEEIERLTRRTFAEIAVKYQCCTSNDRFTSGSSGSSDGNDGKVNFDNSNSNSNSNHAGYTTGVDGTDDVQFRQQALPTPDTVIEVEDARFKDGEGGHQQQQPRTVRVAEISLAFEEAFRRFKAGGEGQYSIATMRHPGTQKPSPDTQQAKACVDKMMEWLRSSRTFDRAPTGRIPTLAEQMTERQKMELELQSKLQEKRRREAGQRHWEEWVSRQARQLKADGDSSENPSDAIDLGDPRRRRYQQQRQQQNQERDRQAGEDQRRKKEQDDAFAAWVREKDSITRAKRREERRAMTAAGLTNLDAINKRLGGALCASSRRTLPRLGYRSDNALLVSARETSGGGGGGRSVAKSVTSKDACSSGKRGRSWTKAERKALDLAVTRVALSPYGVRANEKYQYSKHIEGSEILNTMTRNKTKRFPKALVKEGWEATSQLLGSASMSHIEHPSAAKQSTATLGCGREKRRKRDNNKINLTRNNVFVDNRNRNVANRSRTSGPTERTRSRSSTRQQQRQQRREGERISLVDPAIPHADDDVPPPVAGHDRCSCCSDDNNSENSTSDGNNNSLSFVPSSSEAKKDGIDKATGGVDMMQQSGVGKVAAVPGVGVGAVPRHGERNKNGGDGRLCSNAAAVAAPGVRPDGRRGNSRGMLEGATDGRSRSADGLDGMARDFARPPAGGGEAGGGRRRESSLSQDMEIPIQNQALPDWADTIKDLPVDDPYEEGDDFEVDEESTAAPSMP